LTLRRDRAYRAGMGSDDRKLKASVKRALLGVVSEVEDHADENWYSAWIGTTRIVVEFAHAPTGEDCVLIWAVTNLGLQPTPALYEAIARAEAPLGAPGIRLEKDGTANVVFDYALPVPTDLDERQFQVAFRLVAQAADEMDDMVQAQFGGKLYNDPLDRWSPPQ
jgi:hypothetical protein